MRIVQINAVYGYGSTGHIVKDVHNALIKEGHSSYVFWATKCTEDGLKNSQLFRVGNMLDHKLHAVLRRIKNNQGWNSYYATKGLCRKLEELQPDVVHLHNLHSNYIHLPTLLSFLGQERIATVVTLHDCWLFTGHCMHFMEYAACNQWRKGNCANCPAVNKRMRRQVERQFVCKKGLFEKLETLGVIGVSDWISDCGSASLLKSAKINRRIYNWVDSEIFRPMDTAEKVRRKYGIDEHKRIILGVSQGWSVRKGLEEFFLISEQLQEDAVVLLVGGCEGLQSTESLRFVGFTNNQAELAELYAAADVFVNPSRMETFGKVTAEALSSGTPVVAYDNTAMSELVKDSVGKLVEDGNKNALMEAVRTVLNIGKAHYSATCREAAKESFNKTKLLAEHLQLYTDLLQESGKT